MPSPLRVLHLEVNPRNAEVVRHKLDVEGVPCDILLVNSKQRTGVCRPRIESLEHDFECLQHSEGLCARQVAKRLLRALKVSSENRTSTKTVNAPNVPILVAPIG